MVRIVEPQHNAIIDAPQTRRSYSYMRKIYSPFPVHVEVVAHRERHRPRVLYIHTHLLYHNHRLFTVIRVSQVFSREVFMRIIEKSHSNVDRCKIEIRYSVGEEDASESLSLIAIDRIVPKNT